MRKLWHAALWVAVGYYSVPRIISDVVDAWRNGGADHDQAQ